MKLGRKQLMPLDIQFFAGEVGDADVTPGVDGGNTGETGGAESGQTGGDGLKSFDDLLKDKSYQSEFDKRVAKAIETAKGKWEANKAQELEDAKTEAQKLAKMNAEQKAQYENEKREADYQRRIKELTMRELKATAKEGLTAKGLPLELADVLNYTDAESCNKSIEAVETAFQSAVAKAVDERLRGKGAPKAGKEEVDYSKMSDEEYYAQKFKK